jgi:hypothetical protein
MLDQSGSTTLVFLLNFNVTSEAISQIGEKAGTVLAKQLIHFYSS